MVLCLGACHQLLAGSDARAIILSCDMPVLTGGHIIIMKSLDTQVLNASLGLHCTASTRTLIRAFDYCTIVLYSSCPSLSVSQV